MTTNAVKDGYLYQLIWDDYAKFLVSETDYDVYFISSGKPMIKVTKDNIGRFIELNSQKSEYWNNQFIVAHKLPPLKIESSQDREDSITITSCYNGFQSISNLSNAEGWFYKEWDKRIAEENKPFYEARKRGENGVYADINKIKADIIKEVEDFSGEPFVLKS